MQIDEILNEWEKDSSIDRTDISGETLKVPKLHHKYLKIMTHESVVLKKLEIDKSTLLKLKWEYYQGSLDKQTLDERGWEPFRLKVLKTDIQMYLDADVDLQNINSKMQIQKQKTEILKEIINSITFRNNTIKNYIDYEKFLVGA